MPTSKISSLLIAVLLAVFVSACVTNDETPKPTHGEPRFEILLHNPKWYRRLEPTHSIGSEEGTLNFGWTYVDPLRYPDSFYIGMDTLWMLPQNVKGDTSSSGDWDLQLCTDGTCHGGMAAGVFGHNSPSHFGGAGESGNHDYATEYHVQFYPAIDTADDFKYLAPEGTIVGAMLFVHSRSGKNPNDTVLAYGAWKMEWDSTALPPVRPVNGALPKRSDFKVVNGKVRYTAP